MRIPLLPLCAALILNLTLPGRTASHPNIVFILADDLGVRDGGFAGQTWLETPNLDRLATEGLQFTEAYAAAPICSASRASIMTGMTTARTGFEFVTRFGPGQQEFEVPMQSPPFTVDLDLDFDTLPEVLNRAGYTTAFFGKWHLNAHYKGYNGWSPTHGPTAQGFVTAEEDVGSHSFSYWMREEDRTFLPDLADGELPVDTMNQRAVAYIGQPHDQPFFLMVSHYYVHTPVHTRAEWLYERMLDRIPMDTPRRKRIAQYAAMVYALDQLVGDVLDAVEAAGLLENTLILFTSDNGGHPGFAGNAPYRGGKWNLYEGGIRAPLLVRWPGVIPAGAVCAQPVTGYDLLPTFAELAGGSPSTEIDGISFASQLTRPAAALPERSLYWHFPYYHPESRFERAPASIGVNDGMVSQSRPQSAMRLGDWKLIRFYESGRDELYNLQEDPAEQHDLSGDRPEMVERLRTRMEAYFTEVEARMPVPRESAEVE